MLTDSGGVFPDSPAGEFIMEIKGGAGCGVGFEPYDLSGYEPDELPGCSIPRHQSAAPIGAAKSKKAGIAAGTLNFVDTGFSTLRAGCNAWRRPTLRGLPKYLIGASQVSRPSSRWDRVGSLTPWSPSNEAGVGQKGFNRCPCNTV